MEKRWAPHLLSGSVRWTSPCSDNSCGERIFAVNASILGDTARMFEGINEQVNLEIRQANAFYARKDASRTSPSLSGREHPTVPQPLSRPGGGRVANFATTEGQSFAKALVQARLNVSGTALGAEGFTDGESTELAAPLLFGEYSIFIPATALPQVDEQGEAEGSGLRLNEVDDILLRIDYLSVAR